jgi:hypothetical protein
MATLSEIDAEIIAAKNKLVEAAEKAGTFASGEMGTISGDGGSYPTLAQFISDNQQAIGDYPSIDARLDQAESDLQGLDELKAPGAGFIFDGKYDVLLAYGQSNALGLAGNSGDVSGFPAPLANSMMFDVDTSTIKPIIQNMKSANGETSTGHAWAEFANQYFREMRRGLIVVNAARGAMPIATLAKGNASGYYANAVSAVQAAKEAAVAQGMSLGRTIVCWHQGETDQLNDTSFESYRAALVSMISNLAADINSEFFGICTVGCPMTRLERTWYQIQAAQRFVAQNTPAAAIVFDGCPTFSVKEGFLKDDTDEHYSQRGYNVMGYFSAKSFAQVFGRPKSMPDMLEYDRAGALWSRRERASALASYQGGSWRLASKDDPLAGFRTSGISAVSVPSANTLRFKLSNRADNFFEASVKLSQIAVQEGITAHASPFVSGNDFFVDVNFYIDLRVMISLSQGTVFAGRPLAAVTGTWLASIVSASVAANVATITHGSTSRLPIACHNGGSAALSGQPAAVYVAAPSATTTLVSFGTGTQPANAGIDVAIDKVAVSIAALQLLAGFTVEVGATIAPQV